jgi:hypothetical protein
MFDKFNQWANRFRDKKIFGTIRPSNTGFFRHGKSQTGSRDGRQTWIRPNGKERAAWLPALSSINPFPKKHKREDKTAFKARRSASLAKRRFENRNRAKCFR